MKKESRETAFTFTPNVSTTAGELEEDVYENAQVLTLEKNRSAAGMKIPPLVRHLAPAAVCWVILGIIVSLRIYCTSVISAQLKESEDAIDNLKHCNSHLEQKLTTENSLNVEYKQLKDDNQRLNLENQQLKEKDQQLNLENQQLKEKDQQLNLENQQLKDDNQRLNLENQQLKEKDQQLNLENQQLKDDNQRLNLENQQLKEKHQQLNLENQQLKEKDQQLNRENQWLNAENQQLEDKNQRLKQENQMLQQMLQYRGNYSSSTGPPFTSNSTTAPQNSTGYHLFTSFRKKRQAEPCQQGWFYFQSSCYANGRLNLLDKKTWEEARDDCRGKEADLVVMETPEEQDFIYNSSFSGLGARTFWIGLRAEGGSWKWVTGRDTIDHYWLQPPSDSHLCVTSVQDTRRWRAGSCDVRHEWICQKKALSG